MFELSHCFYICIFSRFGTRVNFLDTRSVTVYFTIRMMDFVSKIRSLLIKRLETVQNVSHCSLASWLALWCGLYLQ